jgi:predicted Fe-Mo cluster-binding NifX family protein
MKIAVASQNRRTITEHTGRCRRFWLYTIENDEIVDKKLLELAPDQIFHGRSLYAPHPLDGTDVLINGGMGDGMVRRLAVKGIQGVITSETDPDAAVAAYLDGSLPTMAPHSHDDDHDHDHHHDHHHHHE